MKKNLIRGVLGMLLLIVLAPSVQAQWTKTTQMTGDDSKINFFKLYNNGTSVFAQTWDTLNGHQLFLTSNGGTSWSRLCSVDSNIDILSVVMVSSTNLLAGTFNGLYQSTNGGTTWAKVTPTGLADTTIWSLSLINDTVFAGTMGDIYFSKDHGTSWTNVKSGLPTSPSKVRVNSFVACGNGIYASTDSNGVFKSTDGPATWTAFNAAGLDSISSHVNQLVTLGSNLFAVTLRGIYMSSNSGSTWTAANTGIKNIRCLLAVNGQLFAGTDSNAVIFSIDSGKTWKRSGLTGLPAGSRVWSMITDGTSIYAGTNTGVWKAPASTVTGVKDASLSSAAKSGLQISKQSGSRLAVQFSLAGPEMVNLAVYDLHGNKVASLVNKKFASGFQSVSFNTRSIAPGSYLVRMTAGSAAYQQAVPIFR